VEQKRKNNQHYFYTKASDLFEAFLLVYIFIWAIRRRGSGFTLQSFCSFLTKGFSIVPEFAEGQSLLHKKSYSRL
jgi:hypothetical protein